MRLDGDRVDTQRFVLTVLSPAVHNHVEKLMTSQRRRRHSSHPYHRVALTAAVAEDRHQEDTDVGQKDCSFVHDVGAYFFATTANDTAHAAHPSSPS